MSEKEQLVWELQVLVVLEKDKAANSTKYSGVYNKRANVLEQALEIVQRYA